VRRAHSKLKDLVAEGEMRADDAKEKYLLLETDVVREQIQVKELRDSLSAMTETAELWKAR
jgi:hypothetical protein